MPLQIADTTIFDRAITNSMRAKRDLAEAANQGGNPQRSYLDLAERFQVASTDFALSESYTHSRYLRDNEVVIKRLEEQGGTLDSMIDNMRGLLQNLVGFNPVTHQPGIITIQAKAIGQTVTSQLNKRDAFGYVFGGSKVDTPPVGSNVLAVTNIVNGDPSANYYQGDSLTQSVQATDDMAVTWGIAADHPVFQNFYAAYHLAMQADANNDQGLAMQATQYLQQAVDGAAKLKVVNAAQSLQLTSVNNLHSEQASIYKAQGMEMVAIDQPEILSRFTMLMNMFEVSNFATAKALRFSSMLSTSLLHG